MLFVEIAAQKLGDCFVPLTSLSTICSCFPATERESGLSVFSIKLGHIQLLMLKIESKKDALAQDLADTDVISRKTLKGFFDKLDQGKSVEEAKAADPVK